MKAKKLPTKSFKNSQKYERKNANTPQFFVEKRLKTKTLDIV
jgi:hypothetical protein